MIYFAIDDKSKEAKKFLELLSLYPFAKIYTEPNATTRKAIAEARKGNTKKADSPNQLFKDLLA